MSSLKYFFDNQPAAGTTEANSRLPSGAGDEQPGVDDDDDDDDDAHDDNDGGSVEMDHHYHHQSSSPQYWRSDVGQKAIKTLPVLAPPLDFRQLNWNNNEEEQEQEEDGEKQEHEEHEGEEDEDVVSNGRLVSTAAHLIAVGSALSAARRNASKRAATAPE